MPATYDISDEALVKYSKVGLAIVDAAYGEENLESLIETFIKIPTDGLSPIQQALLRGLHLGLRSAASLSSGEHISDLLKNDSIKVTPKTVGDLLKKVDEQEAREILGEYRKNKLTVVEFDNKKINVTYDRNGTPDPKAVKFLADGLKNSRPEYLLQLNYVIRNLKPEILGKDGKALYVKLEKMRHALNEAVINQDLRAPLAKAEQEAVEYIKSISPPEIKI